MHDSIVPNTPIDRQSTMATGPLGPVLATATWTDGAWRVTADDGGSVGILRDADGRHLAADQYAAACNRLRELVDTADVYPDAVEDVRVVDLATIRAYGPERCQAEPFAAPHRYNPVREVGEDWEVCGQPADADVHDVETWAAEAGAETAADHRPAAGREAYQRVIDEADPPDRAEVLRRIAELVTSGAPKLGNLMLPSHYRMIDIALHKSDATAAAVAAWASALGLPAPTWGDSFIRESGRPYRTLESSGKTWGYVVTVTAYIDVADDPTGLEGTGWLDEVWVATGRRGVQAHRPDGDHGDHDGDDPGRTACGRSMRTGERTTARQAQDRWGPSWSCRRCWPDGSPITAGGESQ